MTRRRTSVPAVLVVSSPLAAAMHLDNVRVALSALQDPAHPATPKEADMVTSLTPAVTPSAATPAVMDQRTPLVTLQQAHNELAAKVRKLRDDYNNLEEIAVHQADAIRELQAKVEELTEAKAKPREESYELIAAYLRDSVPGVWMSPTAIGVNLDLDAKAVSYRLDRLFDNGKVERKGGKGSGAHPLYRIVPPPKPLSES